MTVQQKRYTIYEMLMLKDGNVFRNLTTDHRELTPIMAECLRNNIRFRIVSIEGSVESQIELSNIWGWKWPDSPDDIEEYSDGDVK